MKIYKDALDMNAPIFIGFQRLQISLCWCEGNAHHFWRPACRRIENQGPAAFVAFDRRQSIHIARAAELLFHELRSFAIEQLDNSLHTTKIACMLEQNTCGSKHYCTLELHLVHVCGAKK